MSLEDISSVRLMSLEDICSVRLLFFSVSRKIMFYVNIYYLFFIVTYSVINYLYI